MTLAEDFFDPHRVRYERCPVCGSEDLRVLHDQDWTSRWDYSPRLHPVIRWMTCAACDHQMTWGYHTPEALDILFEQAQSMQTAEGMTAADMEAARSVWALVSRTVVPYQSAGDWLDVGSGSGMLMAVVYECGFDVFSMEAREPVAEALGLLGFKVLAEDVTELRNGPSGRFDVISLCDVLEHLPFPMTALEGVVHALRPGGVLFVSCPNRDSLVWHALNDDDENPYWAEVEHLHNFSYRQLRGLLVRHGLEPLSCNVGNRYRVCMDVLARKPD